MIRNQLSVSAIEEIKKQYNEVLKLTKDITTFEQIKDLIKNNSNIEEVEVNSDSLSCYKGERIDHFNMSAQAPEFIHGDSAPFYFDKERKSPKGIIIA